MTKAYQIAVQDANVAEIKKQVKLLLNAAGVGDKLPTPKNDIIECAKLVAIGKLDLKQFEKKWPTKQFNTIKGLLTQAISKIKGLIHLKENIIYVDPNVHPSSVPFITYHEVTHKILPSHKILMNPHLDTDLTLEPEFAKGLEIEANIGAALILFQVDRFAKEIKDVPLGAANAIYFAQRYEASLHSAFRNYTEMNHRACALLILNNRDEIFDQDCYTLKYFVTSNEFRKKFGQVDWGSCFFEEHPIYDTIVSQNTDVRYGSIQLRDRLNFKINCKIEIFHNTYNYFVLCYPKQKPRRSKKVVLIKPQKHSVKIN